MALKDLLALADDKLADLFNKQPHDPAKARKPFLRSIEKARKQFGEGKQPRGATKQWSAANNIVCYTPNLDGRALKIGGKDRLYVPSERFGDFLTRLEASVNAGELDDQFEATGGTSRRSNALGGRAWSPARRAAHEARMAEKRKGK